MQKQKEDWLVILSQDERQRGCEQAQSTESHEMHDEHFWKSSYDASNTDFKNQSTAGDTSNNYSNYHYESDHGSNWSSQGYEHAERPPEEHSGHSTAHEYPPPSHSPPSNHNNDHSSQGQVDNNDSVSTSSTPSLYFIRVEVLAPC